VREDPESLVRSRYTPCHQGNQWDPVVLVRTM